MYGLLLDCIQKFLREKYGEHYWVVIRRRAKLQNHWFVTHEVYSDSVMSDLVESAASTLGENRDNVMEMFGEYFAQNIGRYGYARLLRVLGRDLRDFLNGLDDLHEYLQFSYPKMRPPSFFCERESPDGMIMHYTTKRRGYLSYVIGQLHAVGLMYRKDIDIKIMKEDYSTDGCHVVLELNFDNHELLRNRVSSETFQNLEISGPTFLSLFPFAIVFNNTMEIVAVGKKIEDVVPGLKGRRLDHCFTHRRPYHALLKWDSIIMHTNCTFVLNTVDPVTRKNLGGTAGKGSPSMQYTGEPPILKLKGHMMLLISGNRMIFLCSPVMDSPEELYESGIYINDLAMHDSSRDYILAGSQQNPELTLALEQEMIRTRQLEDSIQKTDELLYHMIPKVIADKLRKGETPLNTCKQWPSVSILFADIVSFTPMCMRLRPMEVVCVLNAMYVAFDELCQKNRIYKVQTIGDAYMALCGAPAETPDHAEYMTNFAFAIIKAIANINDPSTQEPVRIRVGIHSGTVVAGVVGSNVLRYDVFGDTVNTAARMEATGQPMKIHISQATAELLEGTDFIVQERGEMEVKGKGMMKTFWVIGKKPSEDKSEKEFITSSRRSQGRSNNLSYDEHLIKKGRYYSVPSMSPRSLTPPLREKSANPRHSITPDSWPVMEESINSPPNISRISRGSFIPGILTSRSIDIGDSRKLKELLPSSVPTISDELKMLATENITTLTEFARVAEENAQKARLLANWADYIVSTAKEHPNVVDRPSIEPSCTRRATVANISPAGDTTHATPPPDNIGTSVDKDDSDPSSLPTEKKDCIIL